MSSLTFRARARELRDHWTAYRALSKAESRIRKLERKAQRDGLSPFDPEVIRPGDPAWEVFQAVMDHGGPVIGRFDDQGTLVSVDKIPPTYVCPRCGAKSWHPDDAKNKYCGRCHRFEDES